MTEKDILENLDKYVKNYMTNDYTGHDFEHIKRVVQMAKYIADREGEDEFFVQILAYVHDLGDYKLNRGEECHYTRIHAALEPFDLEKGTVRDIIFDAQNIGFSSDSSNDLSKAGKIVQDADRLDAMGAIGIARAFAYGSYIDQPISNYFDDKNVKTTRHHFDDKLFKLKDLINTETAREIAEKRHEFMLRFIEEFDEETKPLFPL